MKLKRMIALLCCVSMMMPYTVVDVHAEEVQNVDSEQTLETDEKDEIIMTEAETESETETILETEIVSETVIGNETTETVDMEDYVEEESLLSDENSIVAEGTCGSDATWELNEDGLLTITGSGEIECGWSTYKDQIKKVVIQEGVNSIGNYAFSECVSLQSIEIPQSVTNIGEYAFWKCSSLMDIVLSKGLTSIATHTFAGCTSLQSIEIPEGVTRIDIAAFYGCQNLKQVALPSTLTEICSASFNECPIENLELPDNLQKISEHAFNGLSTKEVVIPESVYYVLDHAFSNSKIESVIFEGKDTTLGTGVFSKSIYLKDVKLPVNLNAISPHLFEGCVALNNIVIPNTVTEICGAAFVNTNIHTLNIPKSVTMLSVYAFSNMSELSYLIFEGDAPEVSPSGQYFDQISNTITIGIPKDAKGYDVEPWTNYNVVSIKNISEVTVSEIDDVGYTGQALKPEVTLSDGSYILVENKDYTVEYKNNLEVGTAEIIINGMGLYEGSTNRYFNIVFKGSCGENATWKLYENGLLKISGTGSIECGWNLYKARIKSVIIEDGITGISGNTFYGCTKLKEIQIPEGITSIGNNAFYGCSSLTNVSIPEGVTSIEYNTFYGCSSLISVSIPEGVTSIGSSAFSGCSSLTNVNIPESVTNIEYSAFSGCSSLTSVNIPEGVTNIGGNAFYGCGSLTSVNIPEGVTTIESYTFYRCSSLTSVDIPESVTTIEDSAFYGCSSLTSVNIPEDVTNIGNGVFSDCSSLTSVNIPEGITNIGSSAFYKCSSLTSVNIPEGVTTIESYTFYRCSSLTSVDIPESVTTIEDWAFSGCSSLTSADIPESVTSIGDDAFYGCSSLTSVDIPEGVTSIGNSTFSGCSSLTSVNIPVGITNIGSSAFSGCSSLTSVSIPESVTTIEDRAFYGCSSLTSVSIPESVTSIGDDAFYDVYNLRDIYIYNSECDILLTSSFGNEAKIHGYCGSTANTFALKYGMKFVALDGSNHIWDEGFITTEPGCDDLGVKTYTCDVCGTKRTESVPSIGHSYSETWTVDKEPGCEESGSKSKHCINRNCKSKIDIIEIEAVGHSFDDGVITIYPTAESEGTIAYTCYTCFNKKFESIPKLNRYKIIYDANGGSNAPDEYIFTEGEWYVLPEVKPVCPGYTFEGWFTKKSGGTKVIEGFNFTEDIVLYAHWKEINASGTCGENATWTYNGKNKILIISGKGKMDDFYQWNPYLPWEEFRGDINQVIIEDGITSIGKYAFQGFVNLSKITLPNTITSIGDYAFQSCTILSEINLPNNILSIGDRAFHGCSALTKIALPSNLIEIGYGAFESCKAIEKLIIPENLSYNGMWVDSLKLKTAGPIGSGCDIEFAWTEKIPSYGLMDFKSLTQITLPDTIQTIGSDAFSGCTSLTKINIPDSVKTIENGAFSGCEKLSSISIPNSVNTLGREIFRDCTSLKNVKLSASATTLPGFANCTSLTKLSIPNGVVYIDGLENCVSLESIVLPDSVQTIGDFAFKGCVLLKTLTLPDNVDYIGKNAFEGCSALNKLTMSTGVYWIEPDAFVSCPKLKNINLRVITEPSTEVMKYYINLTSNNSYSACYDYLERTDGTNDIWSTYDLYSVKLPNNKYFTSYELTIGTTLKNNAGTAIKVKDEMTGTTYTIPNGGSMSNPLVKGFVAQLYSVCLGRKPDTVGLEDWSNKLTSKQIDGVTAAYGFVFSQEFINKNLCNEDYVKQLYSAFLGRKPDAVGLADWVNQMKNGTTREDIFNGFALSQEFKGLCEQYGINQGVAIDASGNGTIPAGKCVICGKTEVVVIDGVSGFVKRLYKVCLNRQADKAGLEDWTGKLKAHKATGRSVAYGFIFSQEFMNKNYSNSDYVEHLYLAFMGRSSDPAGKADWIKRMEKNKWTREQVFDGFVGSQEFTGICESYGITRD